MLSKILSLFKKPKNPEQFLVLELQDVVSGKKARTEVWRMGWDASHTIDEHYMGSGNIPLLGQAVALWMAEDPKHIIEDWGGFFELSRDRMFGNEAGSRIYLLWHIMAVAAVCLWAEEHMGSGLLNPAREWMANAIRFLKLFIAPDGKCLVLGQRSAGHPPVAGVIDWVLAVATAGSESLAEQWCKQSGAGLRQHVEWTVYGPATRFKPEGRLRSILVRAGTASSSIQSPFQTVPGYTFYRSASDEGETFAAWTPRTVNPNTGSILGVIWSNRNGEMVRWFPEDGGAHIRERFDGATIRRLDNKLVYDSNLYGHEEGSLI